MHILSQTSYRKKVLLLIAISFIIRVVTAASLELGNDEVYYWTYSQRLQWNYFDHPPMVAIWIRLFTGNLWLQHSELFVRLGSIVTCAFCTGLLYGIGAKLHSAKAGWIAACLYTASVYASLIAGLFILPDSPQLLFWCLSLLLIINICKNETSWSNWIVFGIINGLCIMCKVHGAFLWVGMGLFILLKKRSWLQLPQVYIAALLTAVIASPILLWNMQNNFATYRFHSERVAVHSFRFNWDGFLREFIGQILYNNPVNVGLILLSMIAWRKRNLALSAPLQVYLFIALPMALLLLVISLFRDTLPHWSGPAYVTLLPMAAICLADKTRLVFPVSIRWSLGIIGFFVGAGLLLIHFYPGTLGSKKEGAVGDGDFTLDLHGWRKAGETFKNLYNSELQKGTIQKGTPVVCYKWFPAAHLDYYFCYPLGIQLIGMGDMQNLHHYIWLNDWRKAAADFTTAICVVPSNESYDAKTMYQNYYTSVDSITTITGYRGGAVSRYFYVYRLSGWKHRVDFRDSL